MIQQEFAHVSLTMKLQQSQVKLFKLARQGLMPIHMDAIAQLQMNTLID